MKYTKERCEELINGSPLFDIDKERDGALYEAERYKLFDLLIEYCRNFTDLRSKRLEEYEYSLFMTANACIKSYDKSRGLFLHFFIKLLFREYRKDIAKQRQQDVRGGMTVGVGWKKIQKITALAKAKNLDLGNEAVQRKIAEILDLPFEEVREVVILNYSAVALSESVDDGEGGKTSIFDTVASGEISAQERLEREIDDAEVLAAIEKAVDSFQERVKPILRDLLTLKLIEASVGGIGKEKEGVSDYVEVVAGGRVEKRDKKQLEEDSFMRAIKRYESYGFYSAEAAKEYLGGKVTARTIGEKYGRSEASVSRTYAEFRKKLKEMLK